MRRCQHKNVWLYFAISTMRAPPNQILPLVQSAVQSKFSIKTKFWAKISTNRKLFLIPIFLKHIKTRLWRPLYRRSKKLQNGKRFITLNTGKVADQENLTS